MYTEIFQSLLPKGYVATKAGKIRKHDWRQITERGKPLYQGVFMFKNSSPKFRSCQIWEGQDTENGTVYPVSVAGMYYGLITIHEAN